MKDNEQTDFGYSKVSASEKTERVREVFESVASKYDVMNDLMSFGLHRLWKKFTLQLAGIRPGQCVLDLAGGTGDLAYAIRNKMGAEGRVICSDINAEMLAEGRAKIINKGSIGEIEYVLADAEALPFPDNSFDLITMAFGLRNVTVKERCLASAYAKLKPGGKFIVLEFSKPHAFLKPAYDLYSFSILPRMGQLVANDADSYRYLAESIRMHPDQESLQTMFNDAGFDRCKFINMTGGIVAAHIGYKY
ncbi:MAG: bifunctional demethylmenaquinone methyltransferase/2-methoxy-6-polyprenyl-1,4-benzoquinol methylase UbiE [Gammaproteobacteria bacterium]|jgi:demethylmenaquinone methyltransferase/2-methoxy-6-polyprenyl-1,4-benzoquinol methylase|nr:bifunctional demethylmenaquinone methyltransferase/2-methoxy-6-polyprenyl-1,4-benzoquinol methylase UbiE [Gammaproteobacteria bacterium]|tara:strand:- start:45129 stop:45875 length:747 start_codon:yes stop_codon:yes gene_type:complete